MRVMVINGGPRRAGNTTKVLGWLASDLADGGHDVDAVHLADQEIRGCISCFGCKREGTGFNCILKDDGTDLLSRIKAADATVLGAPLYFWEFPAKMKALIDRCFCLAAGYGSDEHRSALDGKALALTVTCGGPMEGNADLIVEAYQRIAAFLRAEPVGELVVTGTTHEPKDLPEDARDKTRAFAEAISTRAG
jgi:multimeric flavodoxin WrbA